MGHILPGPDSPVARARTHPHTHILFPPLLSLFTCLKYVGLGLWSWTVWIAMDKLLNLSEHQFLWL